MTDKIAATPGPWVWSGNALLSDQAADYYSEPVMRSEEGAFEPNDADKALIAAAPDLLAALTEVQSWIDNWSPDFVGDDEWPDTAEKMRAALAKAQAR
jgi:hypothetical protein